MMLVTLSKQCIHFFRSDRCPPTSNMCILGMCQQTPSKFINGGP